MKLPTQRLEEMMDWVPVVFGVFKFIVLCTCMFFAIKWHYDQGKKDADKAKERRAVLLAGGKLAIVFMLLLLALVYVTFVLAKKLGLDLSFP